MKKMVIAAGLMFLVSAVSGQEIAEPVPAPQPDTSLSRKITDSLSFRGQASVWTIWNPGGGWPVMAGGRYIPSLNYGIRFGKDHLLDVEGSVNLFGSMAAHPFDSAVFDGEIAPYRAWVRYSSNRWELRAGLQKINFGSASLFRPLMWFDQIDPREPLKLTTGVWGVLSRCYFLNNANFWIWGLWGNPRPRPWDIGRTSLRFPELGGRFQHPVPTGDIAISYHFRMADTQGMGPAIPEYSEIPENRVGLDCRLDVEAGLWLEAAWINKSRNLGIYTNQELLTLGADYTIPVGNGLYLLFEQFVYSNDEKPFAMKNLVTFSGLDLSYPAGIADNLNAIFYFDWMNRQFYSFVNWNHRFRWIDLYLMGYFNPEHNPGLPGNDPGMTISGPGIQVMAVFNH